MDSQGQEECRYCGIVHKTVCDCGHTHNQHGQLGCKVCRCIRYGHAAREPQRFYSRVQHDQDVWVVEQARHLARIELCEERIDPFKFNRLMRMLDEEEKWAKRQLDRVKFILRMQEEERRTQKNK